MVGEEAVACGIVETIHVIIHRASIVGAQVHTVAAYGIYSHQKGYRTGKDTLESIGGKDWAKEFETTMLRQQYVVV